MSEPASVTESDLQAWVDGLLPAERQARVEAYLSERPTEVERLQAYRRQTDALHRHFGPLADEPVPARLRAVGRARAMPWLARAAAVLASLAIGAAAGWTARDASVVAGPGAAPEPLADSLAHRAAVAHAVFSPDARRPVEISAEQQDQLVTWLTRRIGAPIRPPRLAALGYDLIGGRLLPGASGPVAQFMYQDAANQRLTLYVSTEHGDERDVAFRFVQEGPINVFYWVEGRFGYALSAGTDRERLAQVAGEVYRQLAP